MLLSGYPNSGTKRKTRTITVQPYCGGRAKRAFPGIQTKELFGSKPKSV